MRTPILGSRVMALMLTAGLLLALLPAPLSACSGAAQSRQGCCCALTPAARTMSGVGERPASIRSERPACCEMAPEPERREQPVEPPATTHEGVVALQHQAPLAAAAASARGASLATAGTGLAPPLNLLHCIQRC